MLCESNGLREEQNVLKLIAAGGYTLDYGPFGFCELFDPRFQPWTGGGEHFSFFNQPSAAAINFKTFCSSLSPLLSESKQHQEKLDQIEKNFSELMNKELQKMWANKLGLEHYNETLINEFFNLMVISKADYTILFRKLSKIPDNLDFLKGSFYLQINDELKNRWEVWLKNWKSILKNEVNLSLIHI